MRVGKDVVSNSKKNFSIFNFSIKWTLAYLKSTFRQRVRATIYKLGNIAGLCTGLRTSVVSAGKRHGCSWPVSTLSKVAPLIFLSAFDVSVDIATVHMCFKNVHVQKRSKTFIMPWPMPRHNESRRKLSHVGPRRLIVTCRRGPELVW